MTVRAVLIHVWRKMKGNVLFTPLHLLDYKEITKYLVAASCQVSDISDIFTLFYCYFYFEDLYTSYMLLSNAEKLVDAKVNI